MFDWGGGTLDITVVKIENGTLVEHGTSELTGIAGDKFDEVIAYWAWQKFVDKVHGKYNADYLETIRKKRWGRMLAIAEDCKINLSSDDEVIFLLETVIPGEEAEIYEVLSRDEFASLIDNYINKAINKLDDALLYAGIGSINISKVLLTGGTCNIPTIQNKLREKFGHRVEIVRDADLVIAQGAAVVAEYGWLPFLTKDIQVELSGGGYWAMFEHGMPIAADREAVASETFTCTDQRSGYAKIIISDGIDQNRDSILAILNVPILRDHRFGDDISLEAVLDKDIVLHIYANSKMVHGYERNENYTERKTAEIHKMCFGLSVKETK